MPYDYRHVRDAYDALKDAGVVTDSLPDWSAKMNVQSGTDDYSAGLHDNWLKQASVGVDRLCGDDRTAATRRRHLAGCGSWLGIRRLGSGLAGVAEDGRQCGARSLYLVLERPLDRR